MESKSTLEWAARTGRLEFDLTNSIYGLAFLARSPEEFRLRLEGYRLSRPEKEIAQTSSDGSIVRTTFSAFESNTFNIECQFSNYFIGIYITQSTSKSIDSSGQDTKGSSKKYSVGTTSLDGLSFSLYTYSSHSKQTSSFESSSKGSTLSVGYNF